MQQDSERAQETEPVVRPLEERPDTELAPELEDPSYGVDLHNDPEFSDPSAPGSTESAEAAPDWRVAKSLLKLRGQVNAMAPHRSKASDGTIGDTHHCGSSGSTSDHCPRISNGGVGIVTAMDVTHDPGNGCDAGGLASAIRASRDARVKYIIWNKRISNSSPIGSHPAWEWRPYTGANPHNKHVHISVKSDKSNYDGESSWSISGAESSEDAAMS